MLATQLNTLVEGGRLASNCVCQVHRFIVNTLKDGRYAPPYPLAYTVEWELHVEGQVGAFIKAVKSSSGTRTNIGIKGEITEEINWKSQRAD